MTKIVLKFWDILGELGINKTLRRLNNAEALSTTHKHKNLRKNTHTPCTSILH